MESLAVLGVELNWLCCAVLKQAPLQRFNLFQHLHRSLASGHFSLRDRLNYKVYRLDTVCLITSSELIIRSNAIIKFPALLHMRDTFDSIFCIHCENSIFAQDIGQSYGESRH